MRSGTTSLHRYLGAHPEIFMVSKELQFFTDRFAEGLDWYRAQFAKATTGQLLGEATADYLARESAMTRMADVLPNARIVASLRNPVDRAWSHYGLLRTRGREPRSFAQALEQEISLIDSEGPETGGILYLYHGLYDLHLQRAYRLFGKEQIHVAIFERMVADPADTYRSLCAFLGVNASFVPANLGEPVNPFVTFRSLHVRRLSGRLPSPAGRLLSRLNTRRNVKPPQLDPDLRERLQGFFNPRVTQIEGMLGYALPEWRGSEA